MSILDSVVTTAPLAPRITIYGAPGVGKSTLAASFPKPLFLLTEENGLTGIRALPIRATLVDFYKQIKELLELEELPFKTLVVDTVSKLDQLVIEHILASDPKKPKTLNTACGGYGAGFQEAQQRHRAIKALLDGFQARGVTVIYLAHSVTVKHKQPDQEEHDRYSIVMNHDRSREVYVDDVDCVAFCKQKTFVTETEGGHALVHSSDDRIMVMGLSGAYVTKNRYSMPKQLPMSYESFAKHIPYLQEKTK